MDEFYFYIVECSDGSYYARHTDNIEVRISQHEQGIFVNCYTYKRRPVKLVYVETFGTRDEAFAAERQVKGWSRRKKLALIEGDFDRLRYLAKNTKAKEG